MSAAQERALIVEDDPITRTMLANYFSREGYQTVAVGNLAQARAALGEQPMDVLLLDIMLPDGDGIEFAREIRRESAIGIIFVTQRNRDADRIQGLEAAGDDYVTKPINLRELLARVRALCRRRGLDRRFQSEDTVLAFDAWIIDLKRRELSVRNGAVVRLTRGEFDLLAALALARGGTLTRDYLVEVVSNRALDVTPRTVDALVARLRRKLELAVGHPCPIRTVTGTGYRLEAVVGSAP
jgi:two-component system, OmpR family, torCAD operon response regulator TorR